MAHARRGGRCRRARRGAGTAAPARAPAGAPARTQPCCGVVRRTCWLAGMQLVGHKSVFRMLEYSQSHQLTLPSTLCGRPAFAVMHASLVRVAL